MNFFKLLFIYNLNNFLKKKYINIFKKINL